MDIPQYSVAGSSRYQEFRQRLIELADTLNLPLSQAAELVGRPREDSLEATRTKLEQDRFSLVLIGAFQSGKSTLFNYLCDGRELSPVGPAGGGIRTSGCRVSAHCVAEGAEEYAIVSWRNKEQLLRSLGSHLRIHYDVAGTKANNVNYLTEDIVNLDDEQSRMQLASYAWKALYEEKISPDTPIELLRFTLIVCYFYPEFRERIHQGTPKTEIDSAVLLSSYPQDWEHRWDSMSSEDDTIKQPEDIRRVFRAEDVSFAFCAGVEFYLDCANLRSIGCSVYDCPGLFISDWDTEIAKDCIRKADAILYQFSGDKAPSQSDWDAIQETLRVCLNFGGKDKMIFGVNLKVPQNAWGRIEKNSVLPKFHQFGFNSPHIHAIHAGIALRGYEAMLQDYGMLSSASRRAIAVDLKEWEKEDTDANVVWYLRKKQLKKFINHLTDDEQELEAYVSETDKIKIDELANLHGVDALIRHTKEFAENRKYGSMLVHQGTQALQHDVEMGLNYVTVYLESLTGDIEQKKNHLKQVKERLVLLQAKHADLINDLADSIDARKREITEYFTQRLEKYYQEVAIPKIKKDFLDIKPNLVTAPFVKRKRARKFASKFVERCQECFTMLREDIKGEINGIAPMQTLNEKFDKKRHDIIADFEELNFLPSIPPLLVSISDESINKCAASLCPSHKIIMDAMDMGLGDFWRIMWAILSTGISECFYNEEAYANYFIEQNDTKFRKSYKKSLKTIFGGESSPLKPIDDCFNDYKKYCETTLESCNQLIITAEDAYSMANSSEAQEVIEKLDGSLQQLQSKKQEIEALETEIRAAMSL